MSFIRRTPVLALTFVTFQSVLAAQENNWSNLNSLRAGDKIGVIQLNQKGIEGRFQSSTESAIVIRTDQDVAVAKPDVVRVYRRSGHSRTFKMAVGAAIGVAAGAILNGTVGTFFRNEGHDVSPALWIGGAGGIGAGIGALGGGNSVTVYRMSLRP